MFGSGHTLLPYMKCHHPNQNRRFVLRRIATHKQLSQVALSLMLFILRPASPWANPVPVFQDEFEREELGAFPEGNVAPAAREKLDWCIRQGEWEIRTEPNGNRHLYGKGNPGTIAINKSASANFRLEYTTWSQHDGDRSAILSRQLPNFKHQDVYGFHVGGGFSKYNIIVHEGRKVAGPTSRYLPIRDRKQRVVIEKSGDRLVMSIDNDTVFDVRDDQYSDKVAPEIAAAYALALGFYTWSEGVCFDDVKLHQLQAEAVCEPPAEAVARGVYAMSFESETVGDGSRCAAVTVPEGGQARVVNEPNVVFRPEPEGQRLIEDKCLLLGAAPAAHQPTAATFALKPLDDGFVELDVLARGADYPRLGISLVDGRGRALASVRIDNEGHFAADTREETRNLRQTVSHQNRPPDGPLVFQPERWFTIRFAFDRRSGVFDVSLINLCLGFVTPGTPYLLLGSNLPMKLKEPVAGLRVEVSDGTQVIIDNILAAAPRARMLDRKPATLSLRDILGLTFPLRRDPVSLFVHTLRHTFPARSEPDDTRLNRQWLRWETPPAFRNAANLYDALLVRHALLEEKVLQLGRMLFHLEGLEKADAIREHVQRTIFSVSSSTTKLDSLLHLYGEGFRNGWDAAVLEPAFSKSASALEVELKQLEVQANAAARSCHKAAGGSLAPGAPPSPAPAKAAAVWRNGRFERDGRPTCFWPPVGLRGIDLTSRNRQQDALGLDDCYDVPQVLDSPQEPSAEGATIHRWDVFDAHVKEYLLKDNPGCQFGFSPTIGTVHLMQVLPARWFEKYRDDPDTFLWDRNGRPINWPGQDQPFQARALSGGRYAGGGGYFGTFNFWNPAVRQIYSDMLTEWSQRLAEQYPGRMRYCAVGQEQCAFYAQLNNPSAITGFRKRLEDKYKTIAKLNAAWGSPYGSFADIDPKSVSTARPNGLLYEVQLFRQDSYFEWMKLVRDAVKSHLPDIAVLNDFHFFAGDFGNDRALDLPRMFETYDAVGFHSYGIDWVWPMYRMLDSLRKAYDKPLGNFEWAAGLLCRDLFDERRYKASGLRDLFEMMAWGRSTVAIWYGGSEGFSEGAGYWNVAAAKSILRYSTGYLPVARERARRFERIALEHPTIVPKLAIVEPTTSQWNGIDARETMGKVALALEADHWNYGFIHEQPLLERKQSLDGIHTLILPRGVVLQPETEEILLQWIEQGGNLVALLPPGMINPYGQPQGRIMQTMALGATTKYDDTFASAELTGIEARALSDDQGRLAELQYGRGRLMLFTQAQPLPEQALIDLLKSSTPRDYDIENHRLKAVVRENGEQLHVFLINPSESETLEDIFVIPGSFSQVVDLGCGAAFPVKADDREGQTRIPMRLAPGEGTVVRLTRMAKHAARGEHGGPERLGIPAKPG